MICSYCITLKTKLPLATLQIAGILDFIRHVIIIILAVLTI